MREQVHQLDLIGMLGMKRWAQPGEADAWEWLVWQTGHGMSRLCTAGKADLLWKGQDVYAGVPSVTRGDLLGRARARRRATDLVRHEACMQIGAMT